MMDPVLYRRAVALAEALEGHPLWDEACELANAIHAALARPPGPDHWNSAIDAAAKVVEHFTGTLWPAEVNSAAWAMLEEIRALARPPEPAGEAEVRRGK